jgi:cellulose synthase/poly-beta-1,6-N-acetylglucosamine synthase-like glycosyltransferase
MSNRSHRGTLIVLGMVLVGIALLIGPAASWLQMRKSGMPTGQRPDAIYLVAGAHAQKQRVEAAVACLRAFQHEGVVMPPVLIGDDTEPCGWSSELQRNPLRWEVSANSLRAGVPGCDAKVITGQINNTDTEMAVLADYLAVHPEIRRLAVVTSPSHARRAVTRLRSHLKSSVEVSLVQVAPSWRDRAPWFVAMECVKLARDRAGLASSPWFTRTYASDDVRWLNVVLCVALGILAYAWLVYPLVLRIVGRKPTDDGRQMTDDRGQKADKDNVQHSTFNSQRSTQENSEAHYPESHILNPASDTTRPRIAILLSAYNEETSIATRIENLLVACPAELSERSRVSCCETTIHVGIDGSSDRTAEIARGFAAQYPNVHVHEFKKRRGKVAVLKDLVKAVETKEENTQYSTLNSQCSSKDRSEAHHPESSILDPASGTPSTPILRHSDTPTHLLVFTDANTAFHPDALEKLLGHFSDPAVGGVCGRLVFVEKESAKNTQYSTLNTQHSGAESDAEHQALNTRLREEATARQAEHSSAPEGAYWGLETWLKEKESNLDSCLGANGAIYAIRSELFWKEIPDNTIVDDFVIGMKVREHGFRMVYEPAAVAEEELPKTRDEWTRRVRIGAGDFQALGLCRRCLSPRYGKFAWIFWSHKVLRWFTPHVLIVAFGAAALAVVMDMADSNALWSPEVTVSWLTLVGMSGFLVMAWAGWGRLGKACAHFVAMQAALFAGFLRFCRGNLRGSWDRTPR